jgi:L-aspartate oxidase
MDATSGHGQQRLIVVGAGAAGLYTAICAARSGARVTLVSATELSESSSYWAQGGLAAALTARDSPESHLADTLAAGRDAVRLSAAQVLVSEAPAAVADLTRLGVDFDADQEGLLALSLEGGHSHRRIVHADGAATGRRIVAQLAEVVAAEPLIEVIEGRRAVELLVTDGRCAGCVLDDGRRLFAPATVLSTGGAAALWARSTNPAGAVGSGLLLAFAAGAVLADLEFMQFHPTAVVVAGGGRGDGLLVSEAVRGEGALLLNSAGERFVDELAPRDEVARVIHREIASRPGSSAVGLDMRALNGALFPTIVATLQAIGIDPSQQVVPVAPAAHYMMGGIATDLHARTSVPGLYAVGECSCTGLHGANRLASNSLSECFVFGARAANAALDDSHAAAADGGTDGGAGVGADRGAGVVTDGEPGVVTDRGPGVVTDGGAGVGTDDETGAGALTKAGTGALTEMAAVPPAQSSRERLWELGGLVRDAESLRALLDDPHPLVRLIATAALARTESRGAHWRSDHPDPDPAFRQIHITLSAGRESNLEHWG